MDAFQTTIEHNLRDIQLSTTGSKKSNLNRQEQFALNQLRSNTQIIIRPADKGGSVVVLDLL